MSPFGGTQYYIFAKKKKTHIFSSTFEKQWNLAGNISRECDQSTDLRSAEARKPYGTLVLKSFSSCFTRWRDLIAIHQKKVRRRLTHHSPTSSSCWWFRTQSICHERRRALWTFVEDFWDGSLGTHSRKRGDRSAPAGAVFEGVMRRPRDVQWHQDLAPKWWRG